MADQRFKSKKQAAKFNKSKDAAKAWDNWKKQPETASQQRTDRRKAS